MTTTAVLTRRTRSAAAVVALTLLLASCGTRMPDEAFQTLQVQDGGTVVDANGSGTGDQVVTDGFGAGTETPDASGGASDTTAEGGLPVREAPAGAAVDDGDVTAPTTGATGSGAASSPRLTASDVGVTPTTVRVGVVVSASGPVGSNAFSPPLYGAQAFFSQLNARGGLNGRKVELLVCDDRQTGRGNNDCVRSLITKSKVFALVATSVLNYAGAPFVNEQGVPDIGGQPIGGAYDTYPRLYSIYGSHYPRDGRPGIDGKLYGGTEDYRFFKQELGVKKAGVVYYNQAASRRFAEATMEGLRREGYQVVPEEVSFALPNFDAAVVDMKSKGVDSVWDALDEQGNRNLCAKMDSNGLRVKAKVQTVQSWRATVADYPAPCRDSIYATAKSRNYDDLSHPQVKAYRDAVKRYVGDNADARSQWGLEGWVAAKWFTDAATSCGADLTRACVERFMNTVRDYTADGLVTPRDFEKRDYKNQENITNCVSAGRWSSGGWVTVGDLTKDCFTTPLYSYDAS